MSNILRESNKALTPSKLSKNFNEMSFQNKANNSMGLAQNSLLNISSNRRDVTKAAPKLSLRRREITPTRNPNFATSASMQGDRFIPTRLSDDQLEDANFMMREKQDPTFNTSFSAPNSPAKDAEKEQLMRMLRGKSTGNLTDAAEDERILVYKKNGAPSAPVGHMSQAKVDVLYSASSIHPTSSVKKTTRFIPQSAERILDAPELQDDYYMNVLDWSKTGVVAVALSYTLYLWNSETGDIKKLFEYDGSNEMFLPTSVKWSKDGKHLAVGFKDGTVRIYDPDRPTTPNGKLEIRTMKLPDNVKARNACLSWRGATVSAGYQSGEIFHHDVRVQKHITGSFVGHRQEVVGLQWSLDERFLASGSGDQTVRLWDASRTSQNNCDETLHVLSEHVGSVRAVQFCNFKSGMLATGGGSQDKSIKTWNVHSGELLKSIQTDSSVNSIIFNSDYKEMVSGQGCGNICIWKYPTYRLTATLSGHSPNRCLTVLPSPCGQFIMSAGADEALKTWHCFKVDKSTTMVKSKLLGPSIR